MKFNVENNTEIKYVLELLNTAQKEHDWKYVERAYSKLEKLLESNTHIIARPKAIEPTMFRDPAIGNPFNTTIESIQKGQFENHKLARSSVNIDKQ